MKRTATLFLILILFSSACTPLAQVAPVPVIENSTGTPIPIPTWTFTVTALPTLTPTLVSTPTILPTLNPIRKTPPTLMLHRPNLQFDSLAFLQEFIKILQQNNMKVVTYRDIYKNPDITAIEQGKLFIITIDDISLAYPIDRHVLEMIEILREADYPAVLGVVTETDYPYPENVARLKELSELGWEIASHTDNHANLGKLEQASTKLVYNEVLPSLDKIEKTIGIRPITLVLPEGQMVNNIETLSNMGLYWVVGINGGITYDSRDKIIYVGREGPDKDAEYTYKIMKMRFGF
jgi:peptidoglycan/xylan/chitin deacetylase (PgdA/CDA1 family)